nr:Gag-Pol polyprotein [Tanacetum cinerariifolium]
MSTQQDIYTAGSESCPPMLNKENYVPWSSCILRYANSRPNGKLIHNSILNGPYVRRMIPEPGNLTGYNGVQNMGNQSWKVYSVICSTNYSNGENQVVLKSSVVTTADASDKRQQQDSTSSTSTLATTITADGNFDLDEKHVPNTISASTRTKPITISQPPVITKKDVNSDINGLSSTGVDNTMTRRPQPRSNTKHDRVPSASKNSRSMNKEAEVEEHHRNLVLSKNNKHISSACNNKINSQDVISKVVCAMCKKCLISVNHDKCLRNYVNGKNSSCKKQKEKVSVKEILMKYQPKVTKSKKVGTCKSLATPKPRKSRLLLRWSPTGRLFDQAGKIVDSSESKSQSDCSNGDNACTSNILEPKIKPFPNSTSLLDRVPSASKSSRSKNKEAEVEEHNRNLLLSKNKKHMSSACNNFKLDSHNVISKVVCAMCKQYLISVNHDVCLRNYVKGKTSRGKKQKANVSIKEKQKKHQPKVKKPKKVGLIERLATPKPSKPRFLLRWSPTGRYLTKKEK